jgi:bla regulator protein blaR1
MIPVINGLMLAVSGSPAASIAAKATVAAALGLTGVWLARSSRAAVRHALLAAAFAVLLALPVASLVAPPVRIVVPAPAEAPVVPVSSAVAGSISPVAPDHAPTPAVSTLRRSAGLSPSALLLTGWIAGMALFLLPVLTGLWQVRALRLSARPWPRGQQMVERLALHAGIQRRVAVLLHQAASGPMTCGILHPAIVLPPDAQAWKAEDLKRAVVHELEHVRRGDWLSQCLARAVCAVYWFHPLVWIAWRRLALEAERSCDDAVLARSESTVYADQLIALARRSVRSPLLTMANRADLTTRIGAVLDSRQPRGRAGALPVAFACAAAVALVVTMSPLRMVAAPQSAAAQTAAAREFDAVSVKLVDANVQGEHIHEKTYDPGRFSMSATMHRFITRAYGITEGQLSGEPDWFRSRLYSIDAVASAPASPDQMTLMLRAVLADRFQLKFRQDDRDMQVYALEVAPGGPKFKELKPGEVPKDGTEAPGIFARSFTSIDDLMNQLNGMSGGRLTLDRPVVDRTHLTGSYNIQFRTAIETQTDDSGRRTFQFPSLFHDLQSQLGLKLAQARVRMPYFVVEHAAEPTPN